jgi:DNA replication protein DnaC
MRIRPLSIAAPLAKNNKNQETQKTSKLRETPCNDYFEDSKRSGFCENCGHSEKSHETKTMETKRSRPRVITSGNVSRIASADSLKDNLEVGFYILEMDMQGFYLTKSERFPLPKKVYGNAHERAQRIIKTYMNREGKSMGVMCSGRPGTGKTILSKVTANMASDNGLPIIIIRQGFFGPAMSRFLESLPNKCLMFIDEIEKIYDSEETRNWLLSVLDGTVNSSHLWLSTCNNPNIGEAFYSRPGRIRYHYKFEDMDEEVIKGMVFENIKNKAMRKAVIEMALKIQNLTPDVLFSIIEECLIHNEVPKDFMDFLNVDTSLPSNYEAKGVWYMYQMCHHNESVIEAFEVSGDADKVRLAANVKRRGFGYLYNDYGREFMEKMGLVKSLTEIKMPWCSDPISFNSLGEIEVEIYPHMGSETASLNLSQDDIKSTEFKNGIITVYGKEKGEFIQFKPVKFLGSKNIITI